MDPFPRKRTAAAEQEAEAVQVRLVEGPLRASSSTIAVSPGSLSSSVFSDVVPRRPQSSVSKFVGKIIEDSLRRMPLENIFVNTHARITDENLPPGTTATRPVADFLDKYHEVILRQNRSLEKTLCDVVAAVQKIYADQIADDAGWTENEIPCTLEQPCSPYKDLSAATVAFGKSMTDGDTRRKSFTKMIPGFALFSEPDQRALLASRSFEMQLMHRATTIRGTTPEEYFMNGKDAGIHPCMFWMKQIINPKSLCRTFLLASLINDLDLSMTERYVALCLILFRPDGAAVENRSLLSFLYIQYTDIFRHLIASRPGRPWSFYGQFRTTIESIWSSRPDGDLLMDAATACADTENSSSWF